MNLKKISLYITACALPALGFAQDKEALPSDEINVVRAFEPEVNLVSKVNFPPNLPQISTTEKAPQQTYSFGDYFTPLSYTPEDLRPLKYNPPVVQNESLGYLKAGFGNYTTPVLKLGLANKNQTTYRAGLNADFIHSKSKKPKFKQYYELGVDAFGEYFFENLTVGAQVGVDASQYYLYGNQDADVQPENKKELSRRYTTSQFDLYFFNHNANRWGLNFAGNIGAEIAQTNFDNKGANVNFGLHGFKELLGDRYKVGAEIKGTHSINNTLYEKHSVTGVEIIPYGAIKRGVWSLELGPNFLVSNGDVHVLPTFKNRVKILQDKLVMYNEWNSEIGFSNLISQYKLNPYISDSIRFRNYRFQERAWLGLRGTFAQGFSYDMKLAQNVWSDVPLMVNDTLDMKQFVQERDKKVSAWNIHLELEYKIQEMLGVKTAFDYYSYKTKTQEEAWHMPAYKFALSGYYLWNKKLLVGADIYTLGGIKARTIDQSAVTLKPQIDLNLHASYQIKDFLGFFVEVNNILNNKKERWNQYERFGFHGIGGVKVNF